MTDRCMIEIHIETEEENADNQNAEKRVKRETSIFLSIFASSVCGLSLHSLPLHFVLGLCSSINSPIFPLFIWIMIVDIIPWNWRNPRLICATDPPMMVSNIFNVAPFKHVCHAPGTRLKKWNFLNYPSIISLDLSVIDASTYTCYCSVFSLCIRQK